MPRLVSVDDDFNLPDVVNVRDSNLPANLQPAALSATYGQGKDADETISGTKTFNSQKGMRTTTWMGIGAGVGSSRNPFYMNSVVHGQAITNTLAAGGGDDYVGMQTNIKFDGGFAHLKTIATGSMTAGSNVLTLTSGTFTAPVAVGFTAYVTGAGSGGGMPVKAKIVSITSPTTAVLAATASTTVTGAEVVFSLAADHQYAFMANDFYTTGSAAGALSGIENVFGRLTELHIYTPNTALNSIKATSSELDIEASATGTTVATAVAHEISAIRNDPGAAIGKAYGLLIHGKAPANTTEAWGLAVTDGGRTNLTGPTRIGGDSPAAQVPLVVQRPLSASAAAFEIRDYTLTNRTFYVNNSGGAASVSFVTAFEGLGARTAIGSVTGGFAGISFGNTASVEIAMHSTGALRIQNGKSFGLPSVTTANRASAANAGAGGMCHDSTLNKVIFSDGTNWKDLATGATV